MNVRSNFSKSQVGGFTQSELFITILIIGVLSAIAAPNLAQWLRQKQVDSALNEIDFALQETQSEAVKRDKTCKLEISRGTNPILKGDCLVTGELSVTGERVLKGITLTHNRSNPWIIRFNERGENRAVSNGTLWVNSPNGNVRSKCMVISTGIGLRRTGYDKDEDGNCTTP